MKVSHAENERMQTDNIGVTNRDTIDFLYMNSMKNNCFGDAMYMRLTCIRLAMKAA